MNPEQLRIAADCWEERGEQAFRDGDEAEANRSWDMATALRSQANAAEDEQRWEK